MALYIHTHTTKRTNNLDITCLCIFALRRLYTAGHFPPPHNSAFDDPDGLIDLSILARFNRLTPNRRKKPAWLIKRVGSSVLSQGAMRSSVAGASAGGGAGGLGGGTGAGAGIGSGGPCGACKFLRRKCVSGCIFAPYFDSEQGAAHFAAVHKVFGASNVSKLLLQIPPHKRLDAVVTVCYEAQARLHDPIYGCVSHIFALQQQVVNLQAELTYLQGHLTTMELPTPPPFTGQPQPRMPTNAAFSVSNLPSSSSVPATVDLSTLFDPHNNQSQQWAFQFQQQQVLQQQQQLLQQQQYMQMGEGSSRVAGGSSTADGGDLQALARELLDRHGMVGAGSPPEPSTPATQ